ncbi:MAG: ArsR family transcriptional regulator [Candidatus Riflebacteria bacterium HGW-Riflebacteria-1]|jgi:ArsR family transcriptional regulator|nr:MAG: ArsR family transcriptional regulator [Candidatus Riflebacteria bacterium HGW-Riflebacteria-1]
MKHTLNTLKVLGEETRLRIFMALVDQELCVCQIVSMLGLAASTTSKHLALMYQAGIIEQRKDGRWAYYSIASDWKAKNKLHKWLLEELATSDKIKADRIKLAESLRQWAKQVCSPVDKDGMTDEKCC